MKFSLIIFLLFISIFCDEKLFFAFTHFRHGARAPIFPSDSEVDDYGMPWTNPGELTPGGHRMHYLLGVYNRKRYIPTLLNEKYDPHDIYIISSDYNRTIQSALSQLQGLYPADNSIKLNEQQKKYSIPELSKANIDAMKEEINELGDAQLPNYMRLIPVHTFQEAQMRYRNFEHPKCKQKAKEMMEPNVNNEIIKARLQTFDEEWKPYFELFFTGDKAKEAYDYETLEKLADLFITDISEGFEFDEFKYKTGLNDTDLERLYTFFVEFVGRTMNNYQYGDPESKLIKLDMSKLFKELVDYIKKSIQREWEKQENQKVDYKDYSRPKLVMISGHDSMVSVMLLFLGTMYGDREKFWKVPVYASNIAFEVYNTKDTYSKDDYSQYTIKCLFNGELIEGATFKLDEFIEKVEQTAWSQEQIDEFCTGQGEQKSETKDEESNTLVIVLGITTGVFFILCIVFVILWRKQKVSSASVEGSPLMNSQND